MKHLLLRAARAGGGFALARALTGRKLRILAYHGLWTTPGYQFGDYLFMPPEQFTRRMEWLARSPYPVLPLAEAVERLAAGTLPKGATVITIDDGWRSTYTHMLPVLEALKLHATCYVTTYYVERRAPVLNVAAAYVVQASALARVDLDGLPLGGTHALADGEGRAPLAKAVAQAVTALPTLDERVAALKAVAERFAVPLEPWWSDGQFHNMSAAEVAEAARRGLDIELHTHRHRGLSIGVDHVAAEIADNRASLAAMGVPGPLEHFCYPSGAYNPLADDVLRACGVRSATMTEQGINAPGANPWRLRRFLDARSVSQATFEAYLAGALDLAR